MFFFHIDTAGSTNYKCIGNILGFETSGELNFIDLQTFQQTSFPLSLFQNHSPHPVELTFNPHLLLGFVENRMFLIQHYFEVQKQRQLVNHFTLQLPEQVLKEAENNQPFISIINNSNFLLLGNSHIFILGFSEKTKYLSLLTCCSISPEDLVSIDCCDSYFLLQTEYICYLWDFQILDRKSNKLFFGVLILLLPQRNKD